MPARNPGNQNHRAGVNPAPTKRIFPGMRDYLGRFVTKMVMTMNLGEYEKEQIRAIEEWKNEKPPVIVSAFGVVMFPISLLIQTFVPRSAIRRGISGTSWAARRAFQERWLIDNNMIQV